MKFMRVRVAGLSAAAVIVCPMLSSAQSITSTFDHEPIPTAIERPNAETEPVPLPVGIFVVQPSVDFGIGWRSNIFARENAEESALRYVFQPSFDVSSDWARHAMGGFLKFNHVEVPDFSSESFTDVALGWNGRLDVTEALSVSGKLLNEDTTEDRSALSTVAGALEPNEYSRSGGGVAVQHEGQRWLFAASLDLTAFDYDDVEVPSGFIQDQDFRDHDEIDGRVRVAYAVDSSRTAYAEYQRIETDFDLPGIFNAFDRDYEGNTVRVGSNFRLGDSVSGDVGIGFMSFTFADPTYADIEDVSVSGAVRWAFADQTTLETKFSRDFYNPGILDDIASIETGLNVQIAHGVTPKFFLTGGAGFNNYEFENIDRSDDRFDVNVGANWRLNKNLWLESGYELRDSSSPVQAFTDNRVMFRMRVFP